MFCRFNSSLAAHLPPTTALLKSNNQEKVQRKVFLSSCALKTASANNISIGKKIYIPYSDE